jgi:pyruvate,orthophosphate dikinase
MVPLAATKKELKIIYDEIHATAKNKYSNIMYYVGSMIELPRACIIADEIAAISDFVSFGTNDLTQTTLGISRDDCASFMEDYLKLGIYPKDPFQSLDIAGVGFLIKEAVLRAREANPTIKIGICGEHGGDPESIKFFRSLGFDSVSCAPKRLPTAKLAAIL